MNERSIFEAWISTKDWIYVAMGDRKVHEILAFDNDYQEYHFRSIQECWESWQASASREGFKMVPVEPSEDMWGSLARDLVKYMQSHDRYCPKTLKKYFDRFIGEPPGWLSKEVGNWDSDHAFATADLGVFIYKAMIDEVLND